MCASADEKHLASRPHLDLRPSPADQTSVNSHPTGVFVPHAHGLKLAPWRFGSAIEIQTPASNGSVDPHPAGVSKTDADRSKHPWRRCGLAPIKRAVQCSPAGDSPIGAQPANMTRTSADSLKLTSRGRHLSGVIPSPTLHPSIGANRTHMFAAYADALECAGWRCGLAFFVPSPADSRTVSPHPASIDRAGVN